LEQKKIDLLLKETTCAHWSFAQEALTEKVLLSPSVGSSAMFSRL